MKKYILVALIACGVLATGQASAFFFGRGYGYGYGYGCGGCNGCGYSCCSRGCGCCD